MIENQKTVYNGPTLYNGDGSVYNGHGVYNMGNSIPLPSGCVLVDYFKPGFRFGEQLKGGNIPVVNYSDSGEHNLNFLEHSIFGDYFPAGHFDFEYSDDKLIYHYDVSSKNINDFSIEYLIRYSKNRDEAIFGVSVLLYSGNQLICQLYFPTNSGDNYFAYNRLDSGGSLPWSGSLYNGNDIIPGENGSSPKNWKHIAITYSTQATQWSFFINGSLRSNAGINVHYKLTDIYLLPFVYNVNYPNEKTCYYDITQLALWDYAKYLSSFPISQMNKLIIDPDY